MDYQKHYNLLVTRGKNRVLSDSVYVENHHIIPRCMDGTDTPENMVRLTSEEHYVAHQLLVKMYPNEQKLIFAATAMTITGNGQTGRSVLKEYAWIKKRRIAQLIGSKLSAESIAKRTETRRKNGWNKNPDKTKEKQSLASKGKAKSVDHRDNLKISRKRQVRPPCSEEAKLKISQAQKPKKVMCVELGICFRTCAEAAKYIGSNAATNIHQAAKFDKTAKGYHWKYLENNFDIK